MNFSATSTSIVDTSDQRIMLQALGCAVNPKSALYISGPITTGRTFIKWYRQHGRFIKDAGEYYAEFRKRVVRANEQEILLIADKYRLNQRRPVIEPASLFIPDWTQKQYLEYWISVLNKFVCHVVLVEGWQFSVGCVSEFMFAAKFGHVIQTHDGQEISLDSGSAMITEALAELDEISDEDQVLYSLAASVRAAISQDF